MEWSIRSGIYCNIIATNRTIQRYNSYIKYQLVFKQTKVTESILEEVSVTLTSWDCNKINLHASIVRFFIAPTSRHIWIQLTCKLQRCLSQESLRIRGARAAISPPRKPTVRFHLVLSRPSATSLIVNSWRNTKRTRELFSTLTLWSRSSLFV